MSRWLGGQDWVCFCLLCECIIELQQWLTEVMWHPLSGGTLEWPPSPLAALCTEEALSLGGNAERGAAWGHLH